MRRGWQRRAARMAILHGSLLVLIGVVGLFLPASRTNCLIYALARWQEDGGFIVFRRSTKGRYMHVLHTVDLQLFEEANPTWPKATWRWPFPPFWFRWKVDTVDRTRACAAIRRWR